MTKYRELVLNIINSSHKHLTAEEVYELAKARSPRIVKATVYNSLAWLAENGLIKKLNVRNGVINYDKTLTPHEHCVCEICGKITDFNMDGLAEELADCLKRKISGYELTVRTICDECAKKRTTIQQ